MKMNVLEPKVDIKKIIDLRQKLHKFPELSGNEEKTGQIIEHFFNRYNPNQIIKFNNGSLAFVFGKDNSSGDIIFRAELDALPIEENLDMPYASVNTGVAHKCGHDGHIAILTGLAEAITRYGKFGKRAVFLFQSAEETLQGAVDVVSDPQFSALNPEFFIGFHNIPGYPQNSILLKPGEITAYVTGLKAIFKGKSAHAADSTTNMNLARAIMRVIQFLDKELPLLPASKKGNINLTHITYGKPTFGISPDQAQIFLTLRSFNNDDLEDLIDSAQEQLKLISIANKLSLDTSFSEDAPAVFNDSFLVEHAKQIAHQLDRTVIELEKPFAWGEDFGFYTIKYKGLYFGIGAGTNIPQLHTRDYDFPDEIILPTIEFLFNLYLSLSGQNQK